MPSDGLGDETHEEATHRHYLFVALLALVVTSTLGSAIILASNETTDTVEMNNHASLQSNPVGEKTTYQMQLGNNTTYWDDCDHVDVFYENGTSKSVRPNASDCNYE